MLRLASFEECVFDVLVFVSNLNVSDKGFLHMRYWPLSNTTYKYYGFVWQL